MRGFLKGASSASGMLQSTEQCPKAKEVQRGGGGKDSNLALSEMYGLANKWSENGYASAQTCSTPDPAHLIELMKFFKPPRSPLTTY